MRRAILILAMLAAAVGIGLVLSGPASASVHDDGLRIVSRVG